MKKTILKGVVLVIVFIASLYIISAVYNKGNTDMTAEMGPATYPLVYIMMEGRQVNCLRGYAETMESNYLRESLTPLREGRKLCFRIDPYGNTVSGISFEVRNLDGTRLIENTEVAEYEEKSGKIDMTISIKDLIEPDTEYTLVLLVDTGKGKTIRYYTRVFSSSDYHVEEKINYVFNFHEKTFDKEEARELTQYLEPNAEGDNTTFSKVTIHSSFSQVTWGDLNVKKESQPILYIKELEKQTGSFRMKYFVSIAQGTEKTYYAVEEYYRIRYTPDRMYLLDFERTMEQIFHGSPQEFVNSKIQLGIANQQVPLTESDGGNVFAFETENCLYSYNIADKKFVRLFGFYDEQNGDERTVYNGHRSRILNVDEAGNVVYMVYGYMNRGRHEGRVGISVYFYNSTVNTVEEMIYIPYQKSQELLMAEMEQMVYLNKNGRLFLMMNNEVYSINLEGRKADVIVSGMQEGSYRISESNKMLVWQSSRDVYGETKLILMNLQDENQTEIKAGSGEYILPLGFMDEDLIYGLAKQEDIVKDNLGNTIFPMYSIKIQNELGVILKEHHQEDMYVTDCSIENNQITLHRISKTEDGGYEPAEDIQITNKVTAAGNSNAIEVVVTEKYEKLVQIAIKQEVDSSAIKILTPKEVLFEGGREMNIKEDGQNNNRYYVYGKNGIERIYLAEGKAVNAAYDLSGVVINNKGEYVWKKGNLSVKNQIMAISESPITESGSTLSVCLDIIMEYEGIVRNAEYMLRQGENVISILQNNISNIQILDLSGCSLDAILYYVNQDIPVLVTLEDGNAVLIIGFNELNIVVLDPQTGIPYKKGRNDSAAWLEENGNNFITYIRTEG